MSKHKKDICSLQNLKVQQYSYVNKVLRSGPTTWMKETANVSLLVMMTGALTVDTEALLCILFLAGLSDPIPHKLGYS